MRISHALRQTTMLLAAVSLSTLFTHSGLAWGQKVKPRQPVASTKAAPPGMFAMSASVPAGSTLTVSPAPNITANNPGASQSSQTVTLTFNDSAAAQPGNNQYSISVWASTANFSGSGCPAVPTSAITVSCVAGTAPGVGTGKNLGTPPCSSTSSFTLPTSAPSGGNLQASGSVGNKPGSYTATLTFSIIDDFKYYATSGQSCSLLLNYSVSTQ